MRKYIVNSTTTRTFRFSDGVAQGLEAKGILTVPALLAEVWIILTVTSSPGHIAR